MEASSEQTAVKESRSSVMSERRRRWGGYLKPKRNGKESCVALRCDATEKLIPVVTHFQLCHIFRCVTFSVESFFVVTLICKVARDFALVRFRRVLHIRMNRTQFFYLGFYLSKSKSKLIRIKARSRSLCPKSTIYSP